MTSNIILCADDFALTEGVSRGIAELADASRLSATSTLVTTRHWPLHAARLVALRGKIAVGLHFNLTLGKPLGAMPWLCPTGAFPTISTVVRASLARHIQGDEIGVELTRQLDAFEAAVGAGPDFIDGHQHVHALPVVRAAVLNVLKGRYAARGLLVRDPGDAATAILARGGAVRKALLLATLSRGFGDAVRTAGFVANSSFAGISAFDESKSYRAELERFFARASACHLVMCHPGHVDDELPALDPVVGRRGQELAALMAYPDLAGRLWHPVRAADGGLSWPGTEHDHG
jgi:chitin disaccharide deacetylase